MGMGMGRGERGKTQMGQSRREELGRRVIAAVSQRAVLRLLPG